MNISTARTQAVVAFGVAAALAAAWLLLGTPLRIRWIVARGAPPASPGVSAQAATDLRSMGTGARPTLLSILGDGSTSRAQKSWTAAVLLRTPFFAQAEVEGALASSNKTTARAAAFALMEGEEADNFETSAAKAEGAVSSTGTETAVRAGQRPGGPVLAGKASAEPWNPAPAVPVLVDWLADRSDLDAQYAAMLLGKIPPGDVRVRDALLAAVEEVPTILARDAPPGSGRRKFVVVDALQALLPWARDDPGTASRVAKVVTWIEANDLEDKDWDLMAYALRLFEVARGRGVDPALLVRLSRAKNPIVRMKLCHTMEAVNGAEAGTILRDLLGDDTPTVRRAAIYTLRKRQDPLLLDLLPYIVEDSYVYCRADSLRFVGDLMNVSPEKCRGLIPLLVACIEDPWPGRPLDPASPVAATFETARADIVEGCSLSLYKVTGRCPGFGRDAILDWKKRADIAQSLVADPAKRKREVVDEWRKSTPAWPESKRVAPLVEHLEDRDFDNRLRACRELARITGDRTGLPEDVFKEGDDTAARNSLRGLAKKKEEWQRVLDSWRKVADEWAKR